MMKKNKEIQERSGHETEAVSINGKKLVARELTVKQVMDVLENLLSQEVHILESVCPDEPVPAVAAALSVGVEVDELLQLKPSQVTKLFRQVRQANPFLADAMGKLIAIAENPEMLQEKQNSSKELAAG